MRVRTVALLVIFAALSVVLRSEAMQQKASLPTFSSSSPIPIAYLRLLTPGVTDLAGDLIWIEFIQSVPNSPADAETGRRLAGNVEAVVRLSPWFRAAYLHGATLLAVLGNQPCRALALTDQGEKRFPDEWRLPFQGGYTCFIELGDNACALPRMQRAAALPGSPSWLDSLVARLMVSGAQRQLAVQYMGDLLQRTTEPRLHAHFLETYREAIVSRDIGELAEAVRAWQLSHDGDPPNGLEELVAAKRIERIPADPFGGRYELASDGRVRSTSGHTGLTTYRFSGDLHGTVPERMLEQRVAARSLELRPLPQVGVLADRVALAGGILTPALDGLTRMQALAANTRDRQDLLSMQGRILIAGELRRLKAAQLALLRERPDLAPSIETIEARAGVPAVDPFGSRYVLDKLTGLPHTTDGREPALATASTGLTGDSPCL